MTEGTHSIEYSAVRDGGAGLLDLSSRARILVSGSEAVMFLNGLITNDMKTLASGSWMRAAFANVQGRLLAVVRILHRRDGFLIDTESTTHETVLKLLERFTLAGDFHVTDLTTETALLSVQGKKSAAVVSAAFGNETGNVEREKVATINLPTGEEANIIRATHTAEDGFDILIPADNREQCSDTLNESGAQAIGAEVTETLRVEAGIPRYGMDMDETTIVTEANLEDAVSFSKGCYIGQEIIVRIKHRGHVAKRLAGLVLEEKATVEQGSKVLSGDDKEIGRITSSTFSPALNRAIALAYVKYDYLAPGTSLKVATNPGLAGAIADLPFIGGSWYSA